MMHFKIVKEYVKYALFNDIERLFPMAVSMEVSQSPKIDLPYDTTILLPDIQVSKSMCHTDTCTSKYIAALFTTAKLWNQSRCTTVDKWIQKI